MIKFEKFAVKDIVFLAVITAVFLGMGMLTVPLVLSINIFGIRSLVTAPFYALVGTVALMKVRKPGALTLAGSLYGLTLLMMSPVMLLMQIFGSFFGELITLLIFKNYEKDIAAQTAATLYIPLTLPLSVVFSLWLTNTTFKEYIGSPAMAVSVTAGTIILSIIGGLIGRKIGAELRKAGKLK